MHWNQVSHHLIVKEELLTESSLAYCELYVTLGNLFRRFDNMKGTELSEEDRAVNDYISSGVPLTAKRFHVWAGDKVA